MPITTFTTAELLAKQDEIKRLLDTFLEREAAASVRDQMLMPADFSLHYDQAKRLAAIHQETGEPLGWVLWTGQASEGRTLHGTFRLYAVARSCLGLPLPRLRKRRVRKAVAHV